ncbi:MAG: hypothetical protein H2042_18320 [Rhizobiales bacterium]|nr:hypothetical protein [Hyphomicrobiales bacterium]
MYAHRLTPLHAAHRPNARSGALARLSRLARTRVVALALAATAVAAVGAPLLGRLGSDATHLPARPPAPAEPGLFDFPQVRQEVPPAVEAASAPAPVPVPLAAPLARAPAPANAPTLPAGVERFDSCVPACDSRDPARPGLRSAPPAPARPGVLLPPRGVGEGMAALPEPGLIERTFTATRDAVSGAANLVTDQMKGLIGAQ